MARTNNLSNTTKQASNLNGKKPSNSANVFTQNGAYPPIPKRLSIKFKVISTAIALSIIPASLLGISTYLITKRTANSEITQAQAQVAQTQILLTENLADRLGEFLQIRFREVEGLAKNPIFTDPSLWDSATLEQKQDILTTFHNQAQFYTQVTFLDTQGNPLFQSQFSQSLQIDYSDRQYFQQAITSKQIFVTKPKLHIKTGELGIEYIVPVINVWTGEVKGLIYIFLPEKAITENFDDYTNNNQSWYFIDSEGVFFASSNQEYINSEAQAVFPDINNLYKSRKKNSGIYAQLPENNSQLLSYVPVKTQGFYPDKYLGAVITTETFPALIAFKTGSWILILGLMITALIIGLIAAYIANSFTTPLSNSIKAVELISQGKLKTRIVIGGKDELAMLGTKINQMAEKLMYLIERQTMLAKTSELMARITRARSVQQLQSPLNGFLSEVRSLIKSDRLIFYQFDRNWSGTIIAESVAQNFPKSLGAEINDPCFAENYIDKYRRGRIQTTRNIYEAGLTKCHIKQLEAFGVKSNLVIPVVIKTKIESDKNELIGLLIAHQCSNTRVWNNFEIEYLKDVAIQLGLALNGYGSHKQILEQQETFKQKIEQFITQNQKLSQGNLTLNSATNFQGLDELNNFLQETVTKIANRIDLVKDNTQKVKDSLTPKRRAIAQIDEYFFKQTNLIEQINTDIKPVVQHMQIVSQSIEKVSIIANKASIQAKKEKENLTATTENVRQLQKNVVSNMETIKNIEQLSMEFIGTVPIFKQVILQTELLVKDINNINTKDTDSLSKNMHKLALQLTKVISEIEAMGENIHRETSNIIRTMEIDFAQTEKIAPTIESSHKNISKISDESVAINQVLQLTHNSNKVQIEALQKVNTLASQLSQLAEKNYSQSQQVNNSLKATETVVQELEKSVDVFK